MARGDGLPSPLEKRELLWGKPKKAVDFEGTGDLYFDRGLLTDALEFYQRIPEEETRLERVMRIADHAVEEGDFFLLARLRALDIVGEEAMRTGGDNAREAGKLRYALKCYEAAGDEGRAAEVRRMLGIAEETPSPEEGEEAATPSPST